MRVAFAEHLFDSRLRTLTRGGEAIALSPKAFALLELLIEQRPAPVSHEEAYHRLWPDTFVEPGNLHNLVREIRAALGEDGKSIIRTAHRVGYAFAADAETLAAESPFAVTIGDEQIRLLDGENIIGRDPRARIVIDSPDISRQHARILIRGPIAELEDLGSKNGTFLGTTRVEGKATLKDGDAIVIGRTRITFTAVPALAPTVTLR